MASIAAAIPIVNEDVEPARLLRREHLAHVEVLHLAGNLRGERTGSKRVIRVIPDLPATMLDQASCDAVTYRADGTEPGDDHFAFGQLDSAVQDAGRRYCFRWALM